MFSYPLVAEKCAVVAAGNSTGPQTRELCSGMVDSLLFFFQVEFRKLWLLSFLVPPRGRRLDPVWHHFHVSLFPASHVLASHRNLGHYSRLVFWDPANFFHMCSVASYRHEWKWRLIGSILVHNVNYENSANGSWIGHSFRLSIAVLVFAGTVSSHSCIPLDFSNLLCFIAGTSFAQFVLGPIQYSMKDSGYYIPSYYDSIYNSILELKNCIH